MFRIQYFPDALKSGIIVVIPKPGKPAENPNSYRPITLLPTVGKVCERCILGILQSSLGYERAGTPPSTAQGRSSTAQRRAGAAQRRAGAAQRRAGAAQDTERRASSAGASSAGARSAAQRAQRSCRAYFTEAYLQPSLLSLGLFKT